jgi:hypothetical protein
MSVLLVIGSTGADSWAFYGDLEPGGSTDPARPEVT